MFPANRLPLAVTVEYTSRGRRVRKTLPNQAEAKKFYARQFKAGKEPRIVSTKLNLPK